MRRLSSIAGPRRKGFLLTPLVDVIFLLMMFFMLSSHFAAFGLLDVTSAGNGSAQEQPAAAPDSDAVTLRISRGHVSAGEQTIAISELPAAIEEFRKAGADAAVLLASGSATVQDVVSVLEAFKTASFENVTLLGRPVGD